MPADLRAQLLQRIRENLDDNHVRSGYADHLLEFGGDDDAWHAELIRLQLDGRDPGRAAEILRERKTRALGPLARLFEVSWVRGFPERARTRRFTEEHITRLAESSHLPTLRSIELAYVDPSSVATLVAAPRVVTERITELTIADAKLADIAPLLDSDRFPALRRFGLLREARTPPLAPDPDVLAALLTSKLGSQLARIGIWSPQGQRARWASLVPPKVTQLDVYELEYTTYTQHAWSYVRGSDGVLAVATDPVIPIAAQISFYHLSSVLAAIESWSRAKLLALEQCLLRDGHDDEAEAVRELIDPDGHDE